ncbi:hypothetical protein ACOSP7_004067 [Xanthoceras sorbifolium]
MDSNWFKVDCNRSEPYLISINSKLLDISLDGSMCASFLVDNKQPRSCSQTTNTFINTGCGNFSLLSKGDSIIASYVKHVTHVPVVLDWIIFSLSFDYFAKHQSKAHGSSSICERYAFSCFNGDNPTVQCKYEKERCLMKIRNGSIK